MEGRFKVEILENGIGADLPFAWVVSQFEFGKWHSARYGASSTRALAETRAAQALADEQERAAREEATA